MDEDELLDIVDEDDNVVGQARRADAYARRLRHRAAFVLVRDGEDRVFVHRRTPTKQVFPGRYDMFVGGVVGAGETYDDAARREAQEELGLETLPSPTPVTSFLYESPDHTWWCRLYTLTCTAPVHPQVEEIDWHAFLTHDELEARLPEWRWTPDGLEAYAVLRNAR